jgi:type I restriction enzyme M protein
LGGKFVHSARFVTNYSGSPVRDLAVYGQEQKEGTVPLGRMTLGLLR